MSLLIVAADRSIPACTGEPYVILSVLRVTRVYPRVYGGTHRKIKYELYETGLSPRVRGNPTAG